MEGRALTAPDLSSSGKCSDMEKPSTVIDYLSSEWTNEKHSLYLNSREASFVNQLYCREHLSSGLMSWLSRTQKSSSLMQSNSIERRSGKFNISSGGYQKKLYVQKAMNKHSIRSHHLLANACIQHFRWHSLEIFPDASWSIDDKSASQSINFKSPMAVEKTSAKMLPTYYPHVFQQVPVNSMTEGSGQNFDDLDNELGEGTSMQ